MKALLDLLVDIAFVPINFVIGLLVFFKPVHNEEDPLPTLPPVPIIPPPSELQVPIPPKYDWSTKTAARHSVRVICDEMGLTLEQKDTLCATVGGESGWQSYYLVGPKKGQPVKLENKDKTTGRVWSTDWGIAQINDYYHIKAGTALPSVEYVLNNPEAVIRWMCKQWLAGRRSWWVAYTSGLYKQFMSVPIPGSLVVRLLSRVDMEGAAPMMRLKQDDIYGSE